jgi:hypothetical protein
VIAIQSRKDGNYSSSFDVSLPEEIKDKASSDLNDPPIHMSK